jgi:hypothetical protein
MRTLPIPFVAVLLIAATTAAKADLTIIQKTEGTINSGQLTLRIKVTKHVRISPRKSPCSRK